MKIYLAAPWAQKAVAASWADVLANHGHILTTHWWDHREVPGYCQLDCPIEEHEELAEQAQLDIEGVTRADVLVLLNLGVSEGKAVETGVALMAGIPIILVGERSNLFHYCEMVEVVPVDINALLMALDNIEAVWVADASEPTYEDYEY